MVKAYLLHAISNEQARIFSLKLKQKVIAYGKTKLSLFMYFILPVMDFEYSVSINMRIKE